MSAPDTSAPGPFRLSIIVPMGRPDRIGGTLAAIARTVAAAAPPPGMVEALLVGQDAVSVAKAANTALSASNEHAEQDQPLIRWEAVPLAERRLPGATRHAAATRAHGEWLLFVDDDIELAPDFLPRLLTQLDAWREARVGAAGARLPGRESARNVCSRLVDLGNFWYQQTAVAEEREWFYSACLLVRAAAYRETGGFSQTLAVGEDVDLTRRLAEAGWKLWYDGRLVAWHHHRRNTPGRLLAYFWANGRAARYFYDTPGARPRRRRFSLRLAWANAWRDTRSGWRFNRAVFPELLPLLPLVFLSLLVFQVSMEWHYQRLLRERC